MAYRPTFVFFVFDNFRFLGRSGLRRVAWRLCGARVILPRMYLIVCLVYVVLSALCCELYLLQPCISRLSHLFLKRGVAQSLEQQTSSTDSLPVPEDIDSADRPAVIRHRREPGGSTPAPRYKISGMHVRLSSFRSEDSSTRPVHSLTSPIELKAENSEDNLLKDFRIL